MRAEEVYGQDIETMEKELDRKISSQPTFWELDTEATERMMVELISKDHQRAFDSIIKECGRLGLTKTAIDNVIVAIAEEHNGIRARYRVIAPEGTE